jgi:anthranilate synthase component 1
MELPKINIGRKVTYTKFAEDVDFFELFRKIERRFDTCFLFESLGEEGKFSRYSILGFEPQHIISGKKDTLVMDGKDYAVENPYLALRDIMPEKTLGREYAGGLIGYIGYDAVPYFEPSLTIKQSELFDQFMLGVYTDGVILDKETNELFYFYYDTDRSDTLKEIMRSEISPSPLSVEFVRDTLSKEEHAKAVENVKERIGAGDTFQCEVGFRSEYTVHGDTLTVYEKLRTVNPSPFMYYVKFGDPSFAEGYGGRGNKVIIGASPELLFSLRDGEMTTRPLAGTIHRGKDDTEDRQLARALLQDPKEKAEHNMLVDLHRNDIGKVAEFGSVRVRDLMSVKKFSHVQHISSEITGTIRKGEDMFSAFASNFPAGTVSGAPKIESIKIIDRNEREARGPYGGGVGHFGFNGDCTFALAIRSLFVAGDAAYVQTSGGIVYDSEPQKEYEEIQNKLAAMKRVLES